MNKNTLGGQIQVHCLCREWTRTMFLRNPDEDYTMSTKGRLLERLQVILAGRAAEEVTCPSTHINTQQTCGLSASWRSL